MGVVRVGVRDPGGEEESTGAREGPLTPPPTWARESPRSPRVPVGCRNEDGSHTLHQTAGPTATRTYRSSRRVGTSPSVSHRRSPTTTPTWYRRAPTSHGTGGSTSTHPTHGCTRSDVGRGPGQTILLLPSPGPESQGGTPGMGPLRSVGVDRRNNKSLYFSSFGGATDRDSHRFGRYHPLPYTHSSRGPDFGPTWQRLTHWCTFYEGERD